MRDRIPFLSNVALLAAMFFWSLSGCGGGDTLDSGGDSAPPVVTIEFPDGDPSVPPEEGGPGFTGEGWEPTSEAPLEGSPEALKGGAIRYYVGTFPATLRFIGKDSSTTTNFLIQTMCYQALLGRHSDTMEFYPQLASHWQISDDKMTFRYRINPRAHWSDGKPVTADDVVATWDLCMDESLLDPMMQVVYGKFDRPKAISKYIVEVTTSELNWRNFLYFSAALVILPAHEIGQLSGSEFLETYQFSLPVGSGPYQVRESDIKKDQSVTLRRRDDYWAWDERFSTGLFNFDAIRLIFTAESNYDLAFEQAKKGELDVFVVARAKDWVEVIPELSSVQRGLLQMRRVYNDNPIGLSGIALNMRRPPLDDVNVRQALAYLYNRELMIEKLFYDEYIPLDSYHPGSKYANPENPKIRFNLQKAKQLLEQSGWRERDSDGILVKDGRRLELELLYSSKLSERNLTIFQEDCKKVGIKLNFKLINWATAYQTVHGDRNYQMYSIAMSGLVDPNPETSWLSELADKKDNNNITGFKSTRVDEICHEYDKMFDAPERIPALRELDGIIFEQFPYVLGWGADNIRLLFWNKFGQPEWYLPRTSDYDSVLAVWWIDPEKERQLKEARKDESITLPRGPKEIRYWRERGVE